MTTFQFPSALRRERLRKGMDTRRQKIRGATLESICHSQPQERAPDTVLTARSPKARLVITYGPELGSNISQNREVRSEIDTFLGTIRPSALLPPNLIPTLATHILSLVGLIQIYSILTGDSSEVARLGSYLGAWGICPAGSAEDFLCRKIISFLFTTKSGGGEGGRGGA